MRVGTRGPLLERLEPTLRPCAGERATPVRGLLFLLAVLLTAPAAAQDAERGRPVYQKYCDQCHGDEGDGRGIAAPYLLPAPRDFTSAKYQIRSTPTGSLPTDEDIARVIRVGIPGTGMPGFPALSEQQVRDLVALLKSFSPRFQSRQPDDPLPIPDDPGFSADNVETARRLYAQTGCAGCHGAEGRGDGSSAPTLRDDWGQFARSADLTRPWTFNGGPTRRDIFRSLSTGLNGTPMAGFASALSEEQRWQLVDFITAISDGAHQPPDFATVLVARQVDGELDLARGRELFADAAPALFPLLGQVIQPGRAFHAAVIAVEARAVYNRDEIAILVTWHDIVADTAGSNAPDLGIPEEELLLEVEAADGAAGADQDP
ncbi:MAG TPA: c-type cytochrome, partial [Thermoanaerobaculia bacterium]|nr:c-type cytochrome [Thermoanaerobaculia bacterium]